MTEYCHECAYLTLAALLQNYPSSSYQLIKTRTEFKLIIFNKEYMISIKDQFINGEYYRDLIELNERLKKLVDEEGG